MSAKEASAKLAELRRMRKTIDRHDRDLDGLFVRRHALWAELREDPDAKVTFREIAEASGVTQSRVRNKLEDGE